MVAIIGGNSLGLSLTSLFTLGQRGVLGQATQGRNGEQAYVNIATGNLVLQDRDEVLVGRGLPVAALRTYNSQGKLNDDNGDNWAVGFHRRQVRLTGVRNTVGSTLTRVDQDGAESVYAWNAATASYRSTDGSGAHDSFKAVGARYVWTDGGSGLTERYDTANGRLLSRSDTAGNTVQYSYNAQGNLARMTSASGETTWFDYSGNNLIQLRTATREGATLTRVRYGYDAANRLCVVTVDLSPQDNAVADGKTYTTTYTYDGASTRLASATQSDGTSLSFTYVLVRGHHRVATVTDALNQTTSYTYDTVARRTTVTDPMGLLTAYEYDAKGQLLKITAPAVGGVSQVDQFAYNAAGDVIRITDALGRATIMAYDDNGNMRLQRDAMGNVIRRSYDARNQLLTETLEPGPGGRRSARANKPLTTRYVYDAAARNLLRFVLSPQGRVTEYRYDAWGQRTSAIQYAAASYNVGALGATQVPTEATLASWVTTQDRTQTTRTDWVLDARGQIQSATTYTRVDAAGNGVLSEGTHSVKQYVYDQAGQLLSTVEPTAGVTQYSYDGLGRLLSTQNGLNETTLTRYDDALGTTRITLANGLSTTQAYDKAGRLVSVQHSSAQSANLGATQYFYDADNRLLMTQDPTGVRQWMLYDEAGRKVADVDGNGSLTEYIYNANDQITQTLRYANAVSTARLIDGAGLPTNPALTAVRPLGSVDDRKTWRVYDALDRLSKTVDAQGAVTLTEYDGASRVVRVTAYAERIAADTLGSAPVSQSIAPTPSATLDRVTRQFYDDDGLLRATLDAEGYLTEYRYNGAGQLTQRLAYATPTSAAWRATGTLAQLLPISSAQDIATYQIFNAKGLVAGEVDGEGYLTEKIYDNNGNLTQSVRYATALAASTLAAMSTGTTLASLRPPASAQDRGTSYQYDKLSRVTQETNAEGTVTTYGYNNVGQLVQTVRAVGTSEVRTLNARYDLQGRLTGELSGVGSALLTGSQTQAQVDAIWSQYGLSHSYDAAGRRTSTTDAQGNTTLFFHDVDGHLTHTVNALGEVTERQYSDLGQLSAEVAYGTRINLGTLPTGGLVGNALTAAIGAVRNDALDRVTRYAYTTTGTLASSTDAEGNVTRFAYNAFGERTSSAQALGDGRTLTQGITVDRRGLQTEVVTDASGLNVLTRAVYDAFGRVTSTVDANGNTHSQTYDRLGRTVTQTDPLTPARTTSYDAFDRVLTQTDALGRMTRYVYDKSLRSVTVITPEGATVTTVHSRLGQTQSVTDARGTTTSYSYDKNGNLLGTSTPWTSTGNTYDRANRLIQTTDANRNTVDLSYDAANRVLTRRVDAAGLNLTTTYAYDAQGRQISVTDPNQVTTQFSYDRKGQLLRQTVDPTGLNLVTRYSYDGRGKTLTVTQPGGSVTRYAYDNLGRRTSEVIDPTGLQLTRLYDYDKAGNLTRATDANGNVTRYYHDAANRLVLTWNALGQVQENLYDANNRVIKTTAYATAVTTIAVPLNPTLADLKAALTASPDDVVEHRVYDKDGRLTASVNALGEVVTYKYNAAGDVTERRAYAKRVTFSGVGAWVVGTQPAPAPDDAHDLRQRTLYDGLGRAIYTMDAMGAVVAQTFDGVGHVKDRTAYATTIAPTTAMNVDALALELNRVKDAATDVHLVREYDKANRLMRTVEGQGSTTDFAYDAAGQLIKTIRYANLGHTASDSDRITVMTYDAAGRQTFELDALGGLTQFHYDSNGNLTRRTRYAKAVTAPTVSSAHSTDGLKHTLATDAANDRVSQFAFDAANRQVLAVDPMGAVSETVYDAMGNAVQTKAYALAINTSALSATASAGDVRSLIISDAANDRVQRRSYDAANRLVYSVDALGTVSKTGYDGLGRIHSSTQYAIALTDATARTTATIAAALVLDAANDRVNGFDHDAAGRLVLSTDALGFTESFTYDGLGQKTSFTNKLGNTWNYAYDAAGRLVQETAPQVAMATVARNGNGAPTASEIASSNARLVTRLEYNALGNLTRRIEAADRAEQRITEYGYDALGRQISTTYPAANVYDPTADLLTTNGATGLAARTELLNQSRISRTRYDALGNAVASQDVAGHWSYKVHDKLGQVAFDVDALGAVTRYERNAFGEVWRLVRYSVVTTLTADSPASLTSAQVLTAINGPTADHGTDRVLETSYDRAGRVAQVIEPRAYVYDADTGGTGWAGKTTRNSYNAFGDLTGVALQKLDESWNFTARNYHDRRGQQTASVDALGYLTTQKFDAAGNVIERTEFATAISGWNPASPPATAPTASTSAQDRTLRTAYDRNNRKISETRVDVTYSSGDASNSTGDTVTHYDYDKVGNLLATTDALGATTYSYYDALGRVSAVAAPTRPRADDTGSLTPLTEFHRDAHGNVVALVERAQGTPSASTAAYGAPTPDNADRVTFTFYDNAGRATQTTDAQGYDHYYSYTIDDKLAKEWQTITSATGEHSTLFRVFQYDALGRQIHVLEPGSTSQVQNGTVNANLTLAQVGITDTALAYNSFGEVVTKAINGELQEYSDYDNAGRVWRSNSGDGVDKVTLYDRQGRASANIRSAHNVDLHAAGVTIDQIAGNAFLYRSNLISDAMGHLLSQTLADSTQQKLGDITLTSKATSYLTVGRTHPSADQYGNRVWGGDNTIQLFWSDIGRLGSGDVRVEITYDIWSTDIAGGGSGRIVKDTLGSHVRILSAPQAADGVTLSWFNAADQGGFNSLKGLRVSKKDAGGVWQVVIDQIETTFNETTKVVEIDAPIDTSTTVHFEVRPPSPPNGLWINVPLTNFGDVYRADLGAINPTTGEPLTSGDYEYRVVTGTFDGNWVERANGKLGQAIARVRLSTIASNTLTLGAPGTTASTYSWQSPGNGVQQVFRVREAPRTGYLNPAWLPLTVIDLGNGRSGVDLSNTFSGDLEIELLWTRAGQTLPFAHATAVITVTAAVAPKWHDAVGLQPISVHLAGYSLRWTQPAAGTTVNFRYYSVQSGWFSPLLNSQSDGTQGFDIYGMAAGTYSYEVLFTPFGSSAPTATATGTFTTYAQGAGHYDVSYTTTQVADTVTPPDPANYIIGWTGQVKYSAPVVVGYTTGHWDSGDVSVPIYGPGYSEVNGKVVATPYYGPPPMANRSYLIPFRPTSFYSGSGLSGYDSGTAILVEGRLSVFTVVNYIGVTSAGSPVFYGSFNDPVSGQSGSYFRLESRYEATGPAPLITPADPEQFRIPDPNSKPIYGPPVMVLYEALNGPVWVLADHYVLVNGVAQAVPYTVYTSQTVPVQTWVPGTTPLPAMQSTTPTNYAPGYWDAGIAAKYRAAATTDSNPIAISDTVVAWTQALRPTLSAGDVTANHAITQTVDRWGNVLSTTDPRNAAWVTRYSYDANNQASSVERPNMPDTNGIVVSSLTQYYHDALGRQVAVRDALGHVNKQVYDAAGQLVQEIHADTGVVRHGYDAFGDRTQSANVVGGSTRYIRVGGRLVPDPYVSTQTTTYQYDNLGRLTATVRPEANVYSTDVSHNLVTPTAPQAIVERTEWDEAGRKRKTTDGNDDSIRYRYDLRGNLIQVIQPMGQTTDYAFDAAGHKVGETDANHNTSTWTYRSGTLAQNYSASGAIERAGQLVSHKDLGGATVSYGYDYAGHLTSQTSTAHGITLGQNLIYSYDVSGQLTQVDDATLAQITRYAYDAAGHRVREKTTQAGVVYQDNQLSYDAQGRLTLVQDSCASVAISYDLVGNRSKISTHVITSGSGTSETSHDVTRYFLYDAMNRQTVVDAVDAAGALGRQGHKLTYDTMGNRLSDTHWGTQVKVATSAPSIVDYTYPGGWDNGDPVPVYATNLVYTGVEGEVREDYTYDDLNRLHTIERNGVQLDLRLYDGASRVIQSGPSSALPLDYLREAYGTSPNSAGQTDPQGTPLPGNGTEKHTNSYDANGRLLYQRVAKPADTGGYKDAYDISYNNYDAAGNVVSYQLMNRDGTPYTNTYTYQYEHRDSYLVGAIQSYSRDNNGHEVFLPGATTNTYDANGHLTHIEDQKLSANSRDFVNDLSGQVLQATQAGSTLNRQRLLIANGQVLGRYGQAIDDKQPRDANGNPHYVTVADFNFGYQSISPSTPATTPGSYGVNSGDTLQGIAQAVYGDSALWYLIADASGLSGNQDLHAGQILRLPTHMGSANNASTFKPFDQAQVVGDMTPHMPNPPAKSGGGCGLGQLLAAIIAVAVTALTGVGGGLINQFWVGLFGSGTAATVATAATAAALGSIAGQGVGMALGVQDHFSWSQVGLAALGGGIGAGLNVAGPLAGGDFGVTVARAAVTNALTQGIGVATHMQEHFSWRGVAAAAAGTAVGYGLSEGLGITSDGLRTAAFANADFGEKLFKSSLTGLAAGLTTAVMRGGRISATQIATDAFGNALGGAFVEEMGRVSQQAQALRQAELSTGDFARMDGAGYRRMPYVDAGAAWAADVAARRGVLNPYVYGSTPSDTATTDDMQAAFRQSERDYRSRTDRSIQGSAYRAGGGDSISSIVGSSDPQAIGNFMRANGMTSDVIRAGQNYFVPDSWQAYGNQSAAGQWALNTGNDRLERAAAAATAAEVANRQRWDAIQMGAWSGRTNQVAASAPTMISQNVYTAMGDYTGTEMVPLDSRAVMGYGEQMRNVGKFLTDAPIGTVQQIIDNPRDALYNAGQGVVGLVKGAPNMVAEGLTQATVGVRYLAVGGAEWAGLASPGALNREIAQYGDFSGRWFEYDNSAQAAAGFVSGFGAPFIASKGIAAASDLYATTRTAVSASEAWAAGQTERVALTTMEREAWIHSSEIRQTQQSVSYAKLDRNGNVKYTLDDLSDGLRHTPGDDRLVIDVVRMSDGGYASVDNSRVTVMNVTGGGEMRVRLRAFDEPLLDYQADRFASLDKSGEKLLPATWGEAAGLRISNQSKIFANTYPNGMSGIPKISGVPTGSIWAPYGKLPWKR